MPDAPPAPPPTTSTEPPKNDKVLQNIYKTFGLAVDDDFKLKPIPEGDRLSETDRVAAIAAPAPTAPAAPPAAPPDVNGAPATPPPATQPATETTLLEVRKPVTDEILEIQKRVQADLDRLGRRMDDAEPPTAPTVAAPTTAPENPDANFEATLPDENRETIELLRWAEENNHAEFKGKSSEYVAYLKRLDEFRRTNTEQEAVDEFREKNKPQLSETAIRKLARDKIKAEAKAEARDEVRKEMSPELESLRRKQHELEIKPVLAEASKEFRMRFSAGAVKLPDGVERIDPVAAKEIFESADGASKHKVIAPVIQFHAAAADEYMALAHGLRQYDQASQMHRFLDQFIFHQEQVLMKAPPEKQLRDGKQFLPTLKYREAESKDRAGTAAKYWEFSHQDVRRMLEINAHRQAAEKRKEIAEAAKSMGFSEPSAVPQATVATDPPPATTPAEPPPQSPKSTSPRMPGAAANPITPSKITEVAGSVYPAEMLQGVK